MIFWIWAVEMPSAAARSLTVTPERTVAGPVGAGTSSRRSGRWSPRPRRPRWRVSRCGREAAVSMTTRRRPPSWGPRCGRATREPPGGLAAGAVASGGRSPAAGCGSLPPAGRAGARRRACGTGRAGGRRRGTRGGGGRRRRRGGGTRRAIGTAASEGTRCGGLVDRVALQAHAGLGEAASHLSGIEPALAGNVCYTLSRHLKWDCIRVMVRPPPRSGRLAKARRGRSRARVGSDSAAPGARSARRRRPRSGRPTRRAPVHARRRAFRRGGVQRDELVLRAPCPAPAARTNARGSGSRPPRPSPGGPAGRRSASPGSRCSGSACPTP